MTKFLGSYIPMLPSILFLKSFKIKLHTMCSKQRFPQFNRLLTGRLGGLLALLLLGLLIVITPPKRLTAQQAGAERPNFAAANREAANLGYLLPLDLGQDWQTTINLLNLEDQQLEPTLAAYQRDGLFLGSGHWRK